MRKTRAKQLKAKVIADAQERGITLSIQKLKTVTRKLKDNYTKELSR